jgi:transcriptional regulator with XRE-family HTH domain
MKEKNLRQSLGMSQADYAIFLKVSESLVSLEEIGKRTYPSEVIMRKTNFLKKFREVEKTMPLLTQENFVESIRQLMGADSQVETELQKWKGDMEMQEKIVAGKIFKRGRARNKIWENLQICWKAYIFLKSNYSDDADEGEKSMLEAARINHEIKLEENCLRLNKIDFEIVKLNAELAEIKKRLEIDKGKT